ncbi:MAG: ABC transporter substrate-binding protein [Armatimonadota bacterium]
MKSRLPDWRSFPARLMTFLVLLLSIALLPTLSRAAPLPKRDLTIGDYSTISIDLDPRRARGGAAAEVMATYNGLVRVDENLTFRPDLAQRWDFANDEKSVTFVITDRATWPDGRAVTAHDVKYTFDTLRNREFGAPNVNNYEPIDRIDVADEQTVRFYLKRPYPPLLGWLSSMYTAVVPRHIPGERLRTQPFGSGPFTFAEYAPGEKVVLRARGDYWGGRPKFETVTFRAIGEDAARLIALETGQIDVALRVPLHDISRLQRDSRFTVYRVPPSGFEFIGIQTHKPPFNDVRVRQAIAHAINREEIVRSVFGGLAQVMHGPIMPSSWAYNSEVERIFPHDPEKARRLLVEAGYANGFSAKLYMSGRWQEPEYAQVVQAQLRRFGINIQIVQMEFGAYLDALFKETVDGMFILAWLGQWDPDQHLYRPFHSRNFPPAGFNWSRYRNPKVDDLLDKARSTMTRNARQQHYREVQKVIVQDVPYLFLHDVPEFVVMRRELKNFRVGPVNAGMVKSLVEAEWDASR